MKLFILSFFAGTLLIIFGSMLCGFVILAMVSALLLHYKKTALILLSGICLGGVWTYLYISHYNHPPLFDEPGKKAQWLVKGTIVGLPQQDHLHSRFDFQAKQFCREDICQDRQALLRVSWFGKNWQPVKSGEVWQLLLQIKPPHGYHNPGSFDALKKYLHDHVRATGSVKSSPLNQRIIATRSGNFFDNFRFNLLEKIQKSMKDSPFSGVIAGLAIGFTGDIAVSQWDILRRTGTSHLLAISGLHIGLVSSLCFMLMKGLWRRSSRLLILVPAQVAGAWAAIAGALLYSALAGFSIPTQRSLAMVTLLMAAVIFRKSVTTDHTLAVALFVVLLMDPLASLTAGFWLSFLAVALILYVMQGRVAPKGLWWKLGRLQWSVSLGMLPLSWMFFGQGSIVGFAANTVAIPWVGYTVVPCSLLGCVASLIYLPAAEFFWSIAEYSLSILWPYLEKISQSPFAVWSESIYNSTLGGLALIGVFWFLAPRAFPGRYCGLILLIPALFFHDSPPAQGNARIHVLDVGQGLAVIIRTHSHTLIYDTGPAYPTGYDAGHSIVLPYLLWLGIHHIDKIVVSHMDADHSGGAKSLLSNLQVASLVTSEPARFEQYAAQMCERGQQWHWDGVDFQFLYPPLTLSGLNNDSSCVLQISVGEHRILLPGDIEKQAERWLVAEEGDALHSEILLVPHHGSKTSSTEGFIQAVKPDYAIFATGFINRFGFPKPVVVERYQAQGVILLDTQESGMISFELEAGKPLAPPQQYRWQRHYWWKGAMV